MSLLPALAVFQGTEEGHRKGQTALFRQAKAAIGATCSSVCAGRAGDGRRRALADPAGISCPRRTLSRTRQCGR